MVGTRLSRVNRSCASRPNASRPGLSTRSTSLPKSNNGEVSSMLNTPFWFWGLNRSSLNSCKMSRPNCLPENFCSVPFSKRMVISGFSPYEQQTNWPDEGAMALERMSVMYAIFNPVKFSLTEVDISWVLSDNLLEFFQSNNTCHIVSPFLLSLYCCPNTQMAVSVSNAHIARVDGRVRGVIYFLCPGNSSARMVPP